MPHGGYSDDDVDYMYDEISIHIGLAKKDRRRIIFGGGWSAEVASTTDGSGAVGRFANPVGNPRGEWLAAWAQQQGLKLANAFFDKRWRNLWTHRQSGRERVVDYFLIEAKYFSTVTDAGTTDILDLGSDHRTVKVVTDTEVKMKKTQMDLQGLAI
jgi:hypothetical protein